MSRSVGASGIAVRCPLERGRPSLLLLFSFPCVAYFPPFFPSFFSFYSFDFLVQLFFLFLSSLLAIVILSSRALCLSSTLSFYSYFTCSFLLSFFFFFFLFCFTRFSYVFNFFFLLSSSQAYWDF